MSKILTVVVPTYNAERYLRDNLGSFCIPELLNEMEIIIVNDGSTDHSPEIAAEYAERYPETFRVITKENGGHGSGINCGIQNAQGMYFKVVDADDWVEAVALKKLVKALKTVQTDVVYSGFLWAYDCGETSKEQFKTKAEIPKPFSDVMYGCEYQFDDVADRLYMKMHNMTIRTSILREHKIRIDEHCYYVDTEYITYPIPYVETICFVDAFVYYYRLGREGQSVGLDKMQKYEQNYEKVMRSLLSFYDELGNQISCSTLKKHYIAGIIARVAAGKIKIELSFPASTQKKQELKEFDEMLRENYPEIYHSNVNCAVALLRKSRYLLYGLASKLVRRTCR